MFLHTEKNPHKFMITVRVWKGFKLTVFLTGAINMRSKEISMQLKEGNTSAYIQQHFAYTVTDSPGKNYQKKCAQKCDNY